MRTLWMGVIALLTLQAHAQYNQLQSPYGGQIDQAVNSYMSANNIKGLSVGAVKNGQVVFLKGYGKSDVSGNVNADECTVYRIGSVSKFVTSILANQLMESGALNAGHNIRNYVPEFPDKGVTITVGDLLAHTGCIINNSSASIPYMNAHLSYDPIDALDFFKDSPLLANCTVGGSIGEYSNYGYDLLGAVIERAGGEPFENQVYNRLVKPLNLPLLQAEYMWRNPYPGESKGYLSNGNEVFSVRGSYLHHLPSGGFVATAVDLALLLKGFLNDELMAPGTRSNMVSKKSTVYGRDYGYGIFRSADNSFVGGKPYYHGGNIPKGATMILFSGDFNDGVAVISNTDGTTADHGNICKDILHIVQDASTSPGVLPYKETPVPTYTNQLIFGSESNGTSKAYLGEGVTSYSTINSGATIIYHGDYVSLKPGFKALSGSRFLAHAGNPHNGCASQGGISGKTLEETMSEAPGEGQYTARVFPNPGRGQISIVVETLQEGALRVELFDAYGREVSVIADERYMPSGAHHFSFRGDALPPGSYFVRIVSPEGVLNRTVAVF